MELFGKPSGQLLNFIDGQDKEIGNAYIFSFVVTCLWYRRKFRSENLGLKILIVILYGIVTVGFLDPYTAGKVTGHGKHKGKQK